MKLLTLLRTAERTAVIAVFLTMVFLFCLNVLARQIGGAFASDMAWVEETVRLMSLFLTFLAVGLALDRGRHAGIFTWREAITSATGLPLRRIIDAVGFLFCLYLIWLSFRMTTFVFSTGQTSPTLNIPIYWIYLAPTIGFTLMALRFALSFLGLIDRFSEQMTETE